MDVDPDDGPATLCTVANATCAERVEIGGGVFLPVFRTHALEDGDDSVTRGLIVIHGSNHNADDYFLSGLLAAAEAGEKFRTVVVAPHFQTSDDGPAPRRALLVERRLEARPSVSHGRAFSAG